MNCFNHHDTASLGTCKVCGKGLCSECLTDLEYALVCKNKHEKAAEDSQFVMDKSIKIYKSAPKNSLISPVFFLFMGLLFAGFGFFSKRGMLDLPFFLGIGFIVFAIVIFVRNRAIFKKNDS